MTRHIVIGTAGHVDHGKTTLVRALTGVDTDRWEEEKRRGITIDLGFAPLTLGDGMDASIVDVPGHEDFVRNMVAGATGIDLALLVVAADEGVMPQTVEHVAILEALGVGVGVVAVAKADLADRDWLELVTADVRERLAGSGVAWRAVVPVSAVGGAGLDELLRALRAAAAQVPDRRSDDLFRLPVDRAFSVAGAGTVVTGTTWSGVVRVGDEVTVLPGAVRARVRGIQVHGTPQPVAAPGRRTALALVGVDRDAVERGTAVVAGEGWRATASLDVVVRLLPSAPPLSQRTRLRLHLGTAEVLARVTPADAAIPPGGTGAARLRLETPIVARWGDRGVLRSYSPITTIGGCLVADPWPPDRPRRPAGLEALLGDESERVAAAVARAGGGGLPLAELPVRLGVAPPAKDGLPTTLAARGIRRVGDRLLAATTLDEVRDRVRRALGQHHRREPLAPGMPLEAARGVGPDPAVVDAVLADLAAAHEVVLDGAAVRLASHHPERAASTHHAVREVGNALQAAGFEGKTPAELATVGSLTDVSRVLEYLMRESRVVRVGRDRYYDAAALDRMVGLVRQALSEAGEVQVAQLRDRLGLTRKFLIPFLEWLDAQGYTVRVGDARRAGPRLTRGWAAP